MMTVAQQSDIVPMLEMETEQMLQQELDKNTYCVFTYGEKQHITVD
jgi:hypothetical protein